MLGKYLRPFGWWKFWMMNSGEDFFFSPKCSCFDLGGNGWWKGQERSRSKSNRSFSLWRWLADCASVILNAKILPVIWDFEKVLKRTPVLVTKTPVRCVSVFVHGLLRRKLISDYSAGGGGCRGWVIIENIRTDNKNQLWEWWSWWLMMMMMMMMNINWFDLCMYFQSSRNTCIWTHFEISVCVCWTTIRVVPAARW